MACCGCAGAQGWFELGTGANALKANGGISTLCTDNANNLYCAGGFLDSTNTLFGKCYVAKWDNIGHNWSSLGVGPTALHANGNILAICADKHTNTIYAAGAFTDTPIAHGRRGREYVAKWDGANWTELGVGTAALNADGVINTICVDDSGNVYAGGNFFNSSGYYYVAKWDGTSWSEVGFLAANANINSLDVDDSFNLYASGDFSDFTGKEYVAKWYKTTATWTELGTGFDSTATGVTTIQAMAVDQSHNVYVGIPFEHLTNVLKWDGTNWHQLGALNGNGEIDAICLGDSGFVFATGEFTNAAGKVFVTKYDPNTGQWTELDATTHVFDPHVSLAEGSGIGTLCTDNNHHVFAAGSLIDSISPTKFNYFVAEYGISNLAVRTLQSDSSKIKVYPNPALNELNIEITNGQFYVPIIYSLYDATGKLLLTGSVQDTVNIATKINISSFTKGVYILKIKNNIFKFFKN